jgi:hypothetical protein
MNPEKTARIGLGVLAAMALPFGVIATIAPRSFYNDFPGFGRHWIAVDGPYNEHLMRDYGSLNLALGVFTLCAAIWLTKPLVIAAALAWIVYPLPHLAYHLFNLGRYETGDKVGIVAGLVVAPVLAVIVLLQARRFQPVT